MGKQEDWIGGVSEEGSAFLRYLGQPHSRQQWLSPLPYHTHSLMLSYGLEQ